MLWLTYWSSGKFIFFKTWICTSEQMRTPLTPHVVSPTLEEDQLLWVRVPFTAKSSFPCGSDIFHSPRLEFHHRGWKLKSPQTQQPMMITQRGMTARRLTRWRHQVSFVTKQDYLHWNVFMLHLGMYRCE